MLAWVACRYEKMHVLCGMRDVNEIAENAKAGTVTLSTQELEQMESLFDAASLKLNAPVVALHRFRIDIAKVVGKR